MKTAEALLQTSINQYRAVAEQLKYLERLMTAGQHRTLRQEIDRYLELQGQARQTDAELLVALQQVERSEVMVHPLFRQRIELLKEVFALNGRIEDKARVSKSLAASELMEIRGGKTAMTGYRAATARQGGRFHCAT